MPSPGLPFELHGELEVDRPEVSDETMLGAARALDEHLRGADRGSAHYSEGVLAITAHVNASDAGRASQDLESELDNILDRHGVPWTHRHWRRRELLGTTPVTVWVPRIPHRRETQEQCERVAKEIAAAHGVKGEPAVGAVNNWRPSWSGMTDPQVYVFEWKQEQETE